MEWKKLKGNKISGNDRRVKLLKQENIICRSLIPGVFLIMLVLVAGCQTVCKTAEPDPHTGYFPTAVKLNSYNFKVKEQIDLEKLESLLYIRSAAAPYCECLEFVKGSLEKLQFFESIEDKREIKRKIVAENLADSPYKVSNQLILEWLQRKHKNFLIADYSIKYAGNYHYVFDFQLINSANNEIVLNLSNKRFYWGLDESLLFPILNALKDWIDENKNFTAS